MKIFISHASANKEYGNALVDLLRGIGIGEEKIIFTSNVAYGIPIGKNIFNWLKSQINEKPFVIYLLSKEYYASIACLNEMGAAWVIENEHAVIFTPNFDSSSKEFQNGALDPREIGFCFNDEERLLSFIQQLGCFFEISKNAVLINQKLKHYLTQVNSLNVDKKADNIIQNEFVIEPKVKSPAIALDVELVSQKKIDVSTVNTSNNGIYSKLINEITGGKLKDDELILLHYIIETGKVKLMIGWQEDTEIRAIKVWEDVNELNNTLSINYSAATKKFELRGYTEVSAVTGGGNPKEIKLKHEIESNILDLPSEVLEVINKALMKNKTSAKSKQNDFPF